MPAVDASSRCQHLGDVPRLVIGAGRHLGESEVDDIRGPIVCQHQIGDPQIPVGDAVLVQMGHEIPDLAEQVVAYVLGRHEVQRTPTHPLIDQHDPIATDVGDRQESRSHDVPVARLQGSERLVLNGSS